jgi:hypothetical protein
MMEALRLLKLAAASAGVLLMGMLLMPPLQVADAHP